MGEVWGLGYLIAAYVLTWAALAGYGVYVNRRAWRARRELAAVEASSDAFPPPEPDRPQPSDRAAEREVAG